MRTLLILPVLALVACGPTAQTNTSEASQTPAEPADNATDSGINYSAEVLKQNDSQRNATFIRALQDASLNCDHVDSSTRVDDVNGVPTWRATCKGGENYMISIPRDGVARVLSRSDAGR